MKTLVSIWAALSLVSFFAFAGSAETNSTIFFIGGSVSLLSFYLSSRVFTKLENKTK